MPCVDVLERGGLKWYGFIHSTVLFLEIVKNHMIDGTGLLVIVWWKSLLGVSCVIKSHEVITIPSLHRTRYKIQDMRVFVF